MTDVRLNKVIGRFLAGEVVVSSVPVANGSVEEAQAYGDADFDMVIFEMEHFGFDFVGLRHSLQAMLNRRRIHEDGLAPSVVPTTRIPPNAGETSQWIIKQALDIGVYGFIAPQVKTPEEALAIVKAARYPARRGSSLGGGERGYWPQVAARYWGLSQADYIERADVWPLNPDGEILIVALIESRRGVENLERILDATNGIGAIWPGPGDMATDMGLAVTQPPHPEVEEQLAQVLTICSSRGVPCAAAAVSVEDAVARVAQGFQVILTPLVRGAAAAVRAQPHPVRPT
ncbi:MAG TPA: aldolase/citrate lyase family protein [Acidimicrobiales bacterium]|nr:aldolase/citrate lyase family protein [Acidimicrobiales bacterium]